MIDATDGARAFRVDAFRIRRFGFPPGEAKLELKERLSRSKTRTERLVEIETTDKLTEPQIVAKVKEHFRIDR